MLLIINSLVWFCKGNRQRNLSRLEWRPQDLFATVGPSSQRSPNRRRITRQALSWLPGRRETIHVYFGHYPGLGHAETASGLRKVCACFALSTGERAGSAPNNRTKGACWLNSGWNLISDQLFGGVS
jgi:hypothetical protein